VGVPRHARARAPWPQRHAQNRAEPMKTRRASPSSSARTPRGNETRSLPGSPVRSGSLAASAAGSADQGNGCRRALAGRGRSSWLPGRRWVVMGAVLVAVAGPWDGAGARRHDEPDARGRVGLRGQRWLLWLTGHGTGRPVRGGAWRRATVSRTLIWVLGIFCGGAHTTKSQQALGCSRSDRGIGTILGTVVCLLTG
jgi:hypothetical protein